jgi:hypothetical protein
MSELPSPNSICNSFADESVTPILHELIAESCSPLHALETRFAVDGTGIGMDKFRRWVEEKDNGDGRADLVTVNNIGTVSALMNTGTGSFVGPVSTIPMVSINATVSTAPELSTSHLTFTVTRNGDTTNPLTVHFTVGGSATFGSDYTASVAGIMDAAGEGDETVNVTLKSVSPAGVGATIAASPNDSATVTIKDIHASVSVAFRGRSWVELVVSPDGTLTQIDPSGAHVLGGGVRSAWPSAGGAGCC